MMLRTKGILAWLHRCIMRCSRVGLELVYIHTPFLQWYLLSHLVCSLTAHVWQRKYVMGSMAEINLVVGSVSWLVGLHFLYSVILTEYVAMEPRVCMYVCVSVCGSAAAQTDEWILMKFSTNDLTDICEVFFSRILKIRNDDVMAAILLTFLCGTLKVAILI